MSGCLFRATAAQAKASEADKSRAHSSVQAQAIFSTSVAKPEEAVASPSADYRQASSSSQAVQSSVSGRAQQRAIGGLEKEEVPSPPLGKARMGKPSSWAPGKWGKGKGRKSKAPSKHRQDATVEEAFKELATWRYAQGMRRISRSTLAKSRRRPGACQRKVLYQQKQKEKEERMAANRARVPPAPLRGPRTSKRCSTEGLEEAKRSKSDGPSPPGEDTEEEETDEDEEVASPRASSRDAEKAEAKAEAVAAAEEASSSAVGPARIQDIPSSDDEDAQPLDPLEPWQRRMVSKKMTQFKEEVAATPDGMDLGYHLLIPAVPNRRRPVKPHHWASRRALLCRAPWGLSAGIND